MYIDMYILAFMTRSLCTQQTLGLPCCGTQSVCAETRGVGNVVLSGQQADHQSTGNGMGKAR